MEDQTNKMPSLGLSLGVFGVAAVLVSYGVLGLGVDAHIPIVFAGIFAAAIGMFVLKKPWAELESSMLNSINIAMQAVVILMIIGMIIGIWLQAGVVPSLIYYGLKILSPSIFLLATLLICSVVSLATGSSWTTSGTVGIAMLGVAHGLGIPAPLTAGVIISGAYFGDKMSPLSDSTNLAPAVAGSNLFDHIRAMLWSTGPTYLVVAGIVTLIGFKYSSGTIDASRLLLMEEMMRAEFNISLLALLPPLLVIFMAIKKAPAIIGLICGVLIAIVMSAFQGNGLGAIINALHYGYEPVVAAQFAGAEGATQLAALATQYGLSSTSPEMITEVSGMLSDLLTRGGLDSMMWAISLIFAALAFGGIMEACGFLEVIVNSLLKGVHSIGGLMATVLASCVVCNLFLGDQYLSIVLPGRMFKNAFGDKKLAPRMLSRALEDCGTLTSALVPWNTCGAYQSSVLGVPTLAYAPYAFLNYLNPLISVLLTYIKFGIYWRTEDGNDIVAKSYQLAEEKVAE